ncbi:phage integrase [Neisseria bacilliformis ATCC BAA-1200]|uniref:Phage integrase n=1 Tax=Neisseria bacilliformis ATCC BAA-1200 TaxID=888742 RepID=F2BDG5_9NEIS|nr:phage integrase [Neisseria bacilliformis ATCC BAA-1200]
MPVFVGHKCPTYCVAFSDGLCRRSAVGRIPVSDTQCGKTRGNVGFKNPTYNYPLPDKNGRPSEKSV